MSKYPSQKLTLPDGRNLDYLISGDQNGFPFVFIHGTPGSFCPIESIVHESEKKGLKLITLSRAGYGGSTRNIGRRIIDAVNDIKVLLDHLNVKECVVGGWSGGGPHALGCAARLPGCLAALCVAGVAPYDAKGLDWLEGQGQDNIDETNASLAGEPTMSAYVEKQRPGMLGASVDELIEAMASLLPEIDRKALVNNRFLAEHMRETDDEGLRHNGNGWTDDSMAFIAPWGFELDEIKVPVTLWQGSEDLMVPYGHGKWLASALPQDKLKAHLLEGEGHISVFVGHTEDMVNELVSMAKLR